MRALGFWLTLVPLLDQAVKIFLLRRLGSGSMSLGPLGKVQVREAQIWMMRSSRGSLGRGAMWVSGSGPPAF
jgi:hypothetical protein